MMHNVALTNPDRQKDIASTTDVGGNNIQYSCPDQYDDIYTMDLIAETVCQQVKFKDKTSESEAGASQQVLRTTEFERRLVSCYWTLLPERQWSC